MRDRIERFAVLPFSFGCASQECVAVGSNKAKTSKQDRNSSPATEKKEEEAGSSSSSGVKAKNTSFSFIVVPLQKLIKSFKSLSQLFVYREEEDEEEDEEEEREIEIGFPTDVKHVTHIGWDGSTTTNPVKGWENLKAPEILALPKISLKQFELAMAAQAADPHCLHQRHHYHLNEAPLVAGRSSGIAQN